MLEKKKIQLVSQSSFGWNVNRENEKYSIQTQVAP